MVLGAYKIIKLLFPFLKELFALAVDKDGKETKPSDNPTAHKEKITLRTIVVMIGLGSVVLNAYLVERIVALGVELVQANKTIATLSEVKAAPAPPSPPVVAPKQEASTAPDPPKQYKPRDTYHAKKSKATKDNSRQQLSDIDSIK